MISSFHSGRDIACRTEHVTDTSKRAARRLTEPRFPSSPGDVIRADSTVRKPTGRQVLFSGGSTRCYRTGAGCLEPPSRRAPHRFARLRLKLDRRIATLEMFVFVPQGAPHPLE